MGDILERPARVFCLPIRAYVCPVRDHGHNQRQLASE
jgi:hypothetical protein